MKFVIILERMVTGYSACCPDLDGCVAAVATREETIALMQEAIAFHREGAGGRKTAAARAAVVSGHRRGERLTRPCRPWTQVAGSGPPP